MSIQAVNRDGYAISVMKKMKEASIFAGIAKVKLSAHNKWSRVDHRDVVQVALERAVFLNASHRTGYLGGDRKLNADCYIKQTVPFLLIQMPNKKIEVNGLSNCKTAG